jgi:BirA family transcriptional regulator, biotin operon repressor / biotin---[acetyl-CoA-carboxylase] ligase
VFSTRDKILIALSQGERGGVRGMVSGVALAKHLKMTRASIWKHIKALRAEGFPIKTHKASGYGLTVPFDFSLLKGEASKGVRFWRPHYQFSTLSTQRLAMQAAGQTVPEGHLWVVEKQTAGRGRLDRTWESHFGGLWMSLLLRPAITPSRIPSLPLVIALSMAEAIENETDVQTFLKWPNDIVVKTPVGWRKIAGVLTDLSAEVDRVRWVVAGIGVNVNNRLSPALSDLAISLSSLTQQTHSRADLLKAFLDHFGRAYRRFEKRGFDVFRQAYWERYSRPNEPVRLKTAEGIVRGVARGVDAYGALIVESQHKIKSVWEGEIVL